MKKLSVILALTVLTAMLAIVPLVGQTPASGKLIISGDMAIFLGPGVPGNCNLRSVYKKGDPVGFRQSVIDGMTGMPESTAEVVVHITYGGKTVDVPARYRGGPNAPKERQGQWTAKWIVPEDAPTGIVRYKVTAKDKNGRTAEWAPFDIPAALLTIVQ